MEEPRSDGRIGQGIDQGNGTKAGVLLIRLERHRAVELEGADTNIVAVELLCSHVLECVRVHLVLNR